MRRTLIATASFSATLLLAASGCHKEQPAAVVDAGSEVVDAGPPPPPELSLTLRVPYPDGGSDLFPLTVDEPPTIPVVQQLEILTNEPLRNGRIRILDEADRVMASDETLDVSDAGIRDQVSFLAPLIAGHRYTVVVDAQNPGDVLDPYGQVVTDKRLDFRTSGERAPEPAPAPAKKKKPARRKRHHR